MNSVLLHRWLAFPLWLRVLILLCVLAAGELGVRQAWQQPFQQETQRLTQQHQQEKKRSRTLLQSLRQSRPLRETEAEIAELRQALQPETRQPFSLLQLTRATGGHLQSWQPASRGGELTLRLDWPQLQNLFRYLSEQQPTVRLPQFSLQRTGDQLLLRLVVMHEP
ncbi:hypothetical protein [Kalamiella sp. sgz302252]|uniref:HofO family protein n=1 Tax=Pantoea sp. sgz302252 TaxID=3341827 RepID=UPI0036D3EDBF